MDSRLLDSVKVFQILSALPEAEAKRLDEYVASPYFHVRPQLAALYKLLVKARDDGKGVATLRSDVYLNLFPEKAITTEYLPKMDSHLRKLLSDLKVIVDQFLVIDGLMPNSAECDILLCQAYRRLNLNRHFELTVESAIAAIPLAQSSSPALRSRLELETMQYQYQVAQRKWDSIEELPGGALLIHFHVERYKQLCERVVLGRVLNRNYPFLLGDAAPAVLPMEMLDRYPVAKFYTLFYELLLNDNGDFEQLRKLTVETCATIDREECQQMFNYLQNYCSGKVHAGRSNWQRELLKVYLDRLTFDEDVMPQDFMNMVVVAVREKDLESARVLYETGLKKLRNDGDGLTERYLRCYLMYAEGRYSDARRSIRGLHSSEPWLDLSIRTLEIKAWWEDNDEDIEFLLGKINNLIRHLQRESDLSTNRKQTQISRFQMAAKIVRARGNRAALERLAVVIQGNEDLFDRAYLLDRCMAYQQEWCVGD